MDKWLGDVETPTLHRMRLILGEIVGRSIEDRGEIRIEIVVLPESVRIELVGRALVLPEDPDHHGETRSAFPDWVLNDLADRWGVDRRHAEPGIWLLVDRA